MGTLAGIQVLAKRSDVAAAMDCAIGWLRVIESCCTRFDPEGERMWLFRETGRAVPLSAVLSEAVRFAVGGRSRAAERSIPPSGGGWRRLGSTGIIGPVRE